MKYLIDTDWVIDHLNGIEKVQKSERTLKEFLTGIPILGIEEEVCKIFGKERGRLRKEGGIIGDLDLLIGSTCLHRNLILLTNNVAHFEKIENLKIISV